LSTVNLKGIIKMQDDVLILRETTKVLIRSLGILETNKAFCCDYTYAQCHVLMEVAKANSINIVELADILQINKSAVSRTVDELVKKGDVVREQDLTDRRYVKIKLTGQGKIAVDKMDANSREQFKLLLNTIPAEQRQIAIDGAQILSKALIRLVKE
jgi:DNA-binding MarR family transcriptional regulator